ncbi:MAG: isoamylase early set domain-containing protein [Bacteroidetes bacterium]|nr:isoamylase early set domain-containing protein [Rhodothermia bacterium]MCS7154303.1 isoamylase early set domain-containing protein [Bacteroidota bacterium]MCX7906661.1 isoamylase early set domain-containing protein [Bacteroidota bacterium]MDW8137059.1 isoamylase early set domain-containing protein [Bacteroidota bacterium]MDW8285070.1 isoamylase early set domain-containing protein [Bacteroidota bacterium]
MITKHYSPKGQSCRVTFELPGAIAQERVAVVGDFNAWSRDAHLMERTSDGRWRLTLRLKPGRAYRFRYYVDESWWHNDEAADRYVPNPFGSDDCVLEL